MLTAPAPLPPLDRAQRAHADEAVRIWLGLRGADAHRSPRLPDELAHLWLRTEELVSDHRDQWGNWEHTFSGNYRAGRLWEPEVDAWLDVERRRLAADGVRLEPVWPDGRRFAVCLTHDVDRVSHELGVTGRRRTLWKGLAARDRGSASARGRAVRRLKNVLLVLPRVLAGPRPGRGSPPSSRRTLERCLAIEQDHGVVASYLFTVLPSRADVDINDSVYALDDRVEFRGRQATVAEVMRVLAADGMDVGLHGSYHSALEVDVLERQKSALERALGATVTSTRQHYLRFDVGKTPALQAAAGFEVDSTLGFNRNVGFRCGTSLPFRIFDHAAGRPLPLLEVPLVIQDGTLFRADGLEHDLPMAAAVVGTIMERVAAAGGCMTLLFHPDWFVDERCERLYRHCLETALAQGAWVTSLAGIAGWWRDREARLDDAG